MTQVKASIALEERLAEAETRIIELERALNQYNHPKREISNQLDEQRFRRLFEANNLGVAIADASTGDLFRLKA